MKVSELEGAELDYWVARAEGVELSGMSWVLQDALGDTPWSPSTDWSQCGPLMEKHNVGHQRGIQFGVKGHFCDLPMEHNHRQFATDLKVAICRAVVASRFGEEVPDE